MTTAVMLKNVRLSFPDLFEAREYEKGDGKPRFSETLLIKPGSDNDKAIRAAIEKECKEKLGAKWEAKMKTYMGDSNKCCYRDGDAMNNEHFEGHMILAAHRRAADGPPRVISRGKKAFTVVEGKPYANPDPAVKSELDMSLAKEIPYSGCYVNTKVEIYVQGGDYPGIRCSPLVVQFAGDGDAFAGRPVSDKDAEEFEDLSDGADAEDDSDEDFSKYTE